MHNRGAFVLPERPESERLHMFEPLHTQREIQDLIRSSVDLYILSVLRVSRARQWEQSDLLVTMKRLPCLVGQASGRQPPPPHPPANM